MAIVGVASRRSIEASAVRPDREDVELVALAVGMVGAPLPGVPLLLHGERLHGDGTTTSAAQHDGREPETDSAEA